MATFDGDEVSAYEAAVALLQQPDPPTAIFATSDFAAIAAIHAAATAAARGSRRRGRDGRGQHHGQGEAMTPSLSTVGPVDFFDRLADFWWNGPQDPDKPHQVLEFPWRLFVRDSAPATP